MFCPACGQPVKSETALFCAHCGTRLAEIQNNTENKDAPASVQNEAGEEKQISIFAEKEEFFDPDATVRVPDSAVKKYTFNRDADFKMPEPVEEDVFETTAEDFNLMGQKKAGNMINSAEDAMVRGEDAFNISMPASFNSFDATAGKGLSRPVPPEKASQPEKKAPVSEPFVYESPVLNAMGADKDDIADKKEKKKKKDRRVSNKKNREEADKKPAAAPSYNPQQSGIPSFDGTFSQPSSDGNDFFVRQVPVYEQEKENKLKPSTLIIIIVLAVVLFAAAVTGGIFAAQAILNNAAINSIPAAASAAAAVMTVRGL
ncbi:MAG: zinc ribbon domain-containing protein [Clostridia bacterium]|nr:zinc ribbon domain-containing protein [Clostridia bacterium]